MFGVNRIDMLVKKVCNNSSFYSWQKHLLKYDEHVFNNLTTKVVDNNCDLDSFLYEYLQFIL